MNPNNEVSGSTPIEAIRKIEALMGEQILNINQRMLKHAGSDNRYYPIAVALNNLHGDAEWDSLKSVTFFEHDEGDVPAKRTFALISAMESMLDLLDLYLPEEQEQGKKQKTT